jgi:hypothetical protein
LTHAGYPLRAADITGRISALAYSPNIGGGSQALFLGTASGGIWRTTSFQPNSTSLVLPPTWTQVSDNLLSAPPGIGVPLAPGAVPGANNIGSLVVDPANPQTIYAGTGEANYNGDAGYGCGILKSIDGGNTWFLASNSFRLYSISRIIATPAVAGLPPALYAAVVPTGKNFPDQMCGVYRSLNGGFGWDKLIVTQQGRPDPPIVASDLAWTVATIQGQLTLCLYAGLGNVRNYPGYDPTTNGIWQSFDGGATWFRMMGSQDPQAPNFGRISLASDQQSRNLPAPVVYAAVAAAGGRSFLQVVQTPNNGLIWPDITPGNAPLAVPPNAPAQDFATLFGPNPGYYLSIGLVPNLPSTVFLGGRAAFQSTNSGANWSLVDLPAGAGTSPHEDHHAWAFAGSSVFDGNDGGIWQFAPGPGGPPLWTDLNTDGLQTNQVNAVTTNITSACNFITHYRAAY